MSRGRVRSPVRTPRADLMPCGASSAAGEKVVKSVRGDGHDGAPIMRTTRTNFGCLPFGAGRRVCPGINLGLDNIELALTSFLYHFDWKLPDGIEPQDVDISEASGMAASKKTSLILHPRAWRICHSAALELDVAFFNPMPLPPKPYANTICGISKKMKPSGRPHCAADEASDFWRLTYGNIDLRKSSLGSGCSRSTVSGRA
ncbi:hypothetical protein EJB05_56379, partial [Eragrostis curvula]